MNIADIFDQRDFSQAERTENLPDCPRRSIPFFDPDCSFDQLPSGLFRFHQFLARTIQIELLGKCWKGSDENDINLVNQQGRQIKELILPDSSSRTQLLESLASDGGKILITSFIFNLTQFQRDSGTESTFVSGYLNIARWSIENDFLDTGYRQLLP